MSGFLTGKIVLITGGSRGIGRAIALRLARETPEHVVITYCTQIEAAREVVAALESLGVAASATRVDVARPELLDALFDEIRARFGRLDVFVSNAARATFRPVEELSLRGWQRTQDINTRAFLLAGRAAAELMRERGGRIVALSSLGGSSVAPDYAALGAAKAAVESLARYMAVEYAPLGINVNVVCGGLVDTESVQSHPEYEALRAKVIARTPAGRLGRPEDIAGAVAMLCGPDSEWIRGQTIVVDGGFSISY
ncbi:MAG: SDR family oxidoreductase [Acidobacteriota bacterium]